MRKLILPIACIASMVVYAQTNPSATITKKFITDNGKTLNIKLSGIKNKQPFTFSKKYNIRGLSQVQKDAIIKHVTDSLGVKL